MPPALRAFRYRSFRIFFAGQGLSILGTWMQTIATSWLVYRLTGSAFMLGLATAALQFPMLFVAPVAGVWADRLDRRRMLIVVQLLASVQALALAALTWTGAVQVWHVLVFALFLGTINAFETPTRQAFLLDMVESKTDLPNAIALQSMLFNSARFVGPTIAGVVLAFAGEALCFFLNGISYLAVVVAYLLVRVPARAPAAERKPLLQEIAAGFHYAFGELAMRRLIWLLAALSLFTAPWQSLMPIYAGETFAGNSKTLGLLIGAVGLGALAATGFLAVRPSIRGLGRIIKSSSLIAALALTGFASSHYFWLSLALLAVFGFGLISAVASTNTILQTIADDDKRGRIISIYVMTFLGLAPISNFVAGAVAEAIGAHWTVFACGVGLTVATGLFALNYESWRRSIRPIYVKQGIIPPPPTETQ
jgi:MFS family permease